MATEVKIVREWDANTFHQRVLELEAAGYTARLETYAVTPEMDPGTGEVSHLHTIELLKSEESGGADAAEARGRPA